MIRSLSLRQRLLLLSLAPSTLLSVVLVFYFVFSSVQALEDELRERGLSLVRHLAPASEYGLLAGHLESLQNLAQTTVQQPNVKAAVVVGGTGQILAVSGRVSLSSTELKHQASAPGLIIDHPDWIAFGAPVRRSLAENDPLFDSAGTREAPRIIGQVLVEFDKSEFHQRQEALILSGVLIIVAGLLLGAATAFALAGGITRPMKRLVNAVRAMGEGQFETRVAPLSGGEFDELEQGFNDMAAHIAEVHRTLQERIEVATAQLAYQASHDALTGLVNRREFETCLEGSLSAIQTGGEENSLLFLDFDRFKVVNDTCGHLAGDELLRQICCILKGRLRDEDTLARIGGDEFGILLVRCSGARALQVAEDLCRLVADYRFIWQGKVFSIGLSIGLTPVSQRVGSVHELFAAADVACYAAKAGGGNQVQVRAACLPRKRRQNASSWPEPNPGALAEKRLICQAMPLQPLDTSAQTSAPFVELGARLDKRGPPTLPLSRMRDTAKHHDSALAIDAMILEAAVTAQARVRAQGRRMRCLIPLSAPSICHPPTIAQLARALEKHAVAAADLYLLFSEEGTVQHAAQTADLCRSARSLGYRIALGEFGGAFASFDHLRALQPDCVKISRSLTHHLDDNRSAQVLVRAIQEITADLGIETIVEGVDDLTAFERLQKIGFTYAQGHAVAPSEPFEDWVEGVVMRGSC